LSSSREENTTAKVERVESTADSTAEAASSHTRESHFARFHDVQKRFEETRAGKRVIVGLIVIVVAVQIVWNLPDSTIRNGLATVARPAGAVGLTERWPMFAPNPNQRTENVFVTVTMADGTTRVWTVEPYPRAKRLVVPNRWLGFQESAVRFEEVRQDLARWVVSEVTGPGEQPAKVVMTLRIERLAPPGQGGPISPAERILYEENLVGQP
jgi:hypothetical protein